MNVGPRSEARLFAHDAMNTTFHLRIFAEESLARDMARECFDLLDLLESHLSRFIAGSDISRINSMSAGETLYLSDASHKCLLAGLDAHARTGGLFDITLGRRIEHQKSGVTDEMPEISGKLTIHPDVPAITCEAPGREIDLGGIGKGFALDQIKERLLEWGAEGGLLTAGASSLLAFGKQGWPVDLAGSQESRRVQLLEGSISASGTGIQGSHIVHPAGSGAMPALPCHRLWVRADTAALAEVWSTALMLVEPDQIADFIDKDASIHEVYIDRDSKVERLL